MTTVTFYHSAICPRCRLASLAIRSVIKDYPGIEVERVEYLTHRRQAHDAGARSIPALVSGSNVLSGIFLTRTAIRRFFDSLA